MTAVVLVNDLENLAAEANAEHRACMSAAATALTHAIKAGEALLAAKEIVGRGNWEQWVTDNAEAAPNQARAYMRLAHYQHHLPAHETRISHGLQYLRGLPGVDGTGQAYPPEIREEALRLCEAGMSNRQAAAVLGICKTTVDDWVQRATGRRGKGGRPGKTRARLARERAQRLAWRKEQRRKAAQRTGGSAGAAYALLRRTCDVLDKAVADTDEKPAKHALQQALVALYRADDAIVEAMGWEQGGRKAA